MSRESPKIYAAAVYVTAYYHEENLDCQEFFEPLREAFGEPVNLFQAFWRAENLPSAGAHHESYAGGEWSQEEVNEFALLKDHVQGFDNYKEVCIKVEQGKNKTKLRNLLRIKKIFSTPWVLSHQHILPYPEVQNYGN